MCLCVSPCSTGGCQGQLHWRVMSRTEYNGSSGQNRDVTTQETHRTPTVETREQSAGNDIIADTDYHHVYNSEIHTLISITLRIVIYNSMWSRPHQDPKENLCLGLVLKCLARPGFVGADIEWWVQACTSKMLWGVAVSAGQDGMKNTAAFRAGRWLKVTTEMGKKQKTLTKYKGKNANCMCEFEVNCTHILLNKFRGLEVWIRSFIGTQRAWRYGPRCDVLVQFSGIEINYKPRYITWATKLVENKLR